MNEGIDDFCDALNKLPTEDRDGLVSSCCMLIGRYPDPSGNPSPKTMGDRYKHLTLEDLRARMHWLVDEELFSEHFLVGGLLAFLIDENEHWSTRDAQSDVIDEHLKRIEFAKGQLALPQEKRLLSASDKQLKSFLRLVERFASETGEQREKAERLHEWLVGLQSSHFTRDYWSELNRRQMREMHKP
jgi:hypothetical protein